MLAENVTDIKPELDFTSDMGFTYPFIEETLEITGQEAVSVLNPWLVRVFSIRTSLTGFSIVLSASQ